MTPASRWGLPDASADLVVGDAFGSLSVPWHLATREFLTDVRRVLRPGGVLVLNVIDYAPREFLAAETATVAAVFADGDVVVLGRPDQLGAAAGGNFVVAASTRALDRSALAAAADARGEPGAVLGAERTRTARRCPGPDRRLRPRRPAPHPLRPPPPR